MTRILRFAAVGVGLLAAAPSLSQAPPDRAGTPAPTSGSRGAADGAGLSLSEAVAMALRENVDLRVESLNSSLSREDLRRSRAIYDPHLTGALSAGQTRRVDASRASRNGGASLGLSQLLPTGGSIAASTQTGFDTAYEPQPGASDYDYASSVSVFVTQPLLKNAGRKVTEVNVVLARNALQDAFDRYRFAAADTVLAVVTAYNRLYSLRRAFEVREASLAAAQKLLEAAKAKSRRAARRAIDLANAEFGVAQRLKEVVDAETAMRDQEASLRYLLGMPAGEIVPTDPPTEEDPQAAKEQAVATALDLRLDLKQLRSAVESSDFLSGVAKNQTLPDVSLFVGGGLDGDDGTFGNNMREMRKGQGFWSAGVQVSVPLGDRAAEADYRASRIRAEQARTQVSALSWRIRNDVESDIRSLLSARLQVHVAAKALEQAVGRWEEYRRDHQAGTATTQDVLDAEADLAAARSARINAAEGYAAVLMKLWRDTGELLGRLGVTVKVGS